MNGPFDLRVVKRGDKLYHAEIRCPIDGLWNDLDDEMLEGIEPVKCHHPGCGWQAQERFGLGLTMPEAERR